MPALATNEAAEKLAKAVDKATPSTLAEICADFFPDHPSSTPPTAGIVARLIREGFATGNLVAEELVDLWNVVFPDDHDVYYNEDTEAIHYNEELVEYAD